MRTICVAAVVGALCAWAAPAECKDKYEIVTELQFQVNKNKLVGQTIALLTYMGDLTDVAGREVPSTTGKGSTFAIQATAYRGLAKFTIADTKENAETLSVFYSLTPGAPNRPGSMITIYGKVLKTGPDEVSILVQREGEPAIVEGWPENMALCPTCGRPGYDKAKKPEAKPPKRPR
ncbi:MAG: hypothetical protein AB1696_11950 [Planctomycetota bacterium]